MKMPFVPRVLCLVLLLSITLTFEFLASASPQETLRTIVSDDFTKARPKPRKRVKPAGHPGRASRKYYTPSTPIFQPLALNALQVGLTVWKVERVVGTTFTSLHRAGQWQWISKRIAADTKFQEGDFIRLSIESPRAGYLYVINRDWLSDGSYGATNLIFPFRDEDNRLEAGKLIDIPAEDQQPFRASPSANQAGELLTILVTSAPLPLTLTDSPIPISPGQLTEWEERWGGFARRFEMNGGVGQVRTTAEKQAASRKRTRQLTRDDPAPQTIYLVSPRNNDGLLFNLMLAYIK